MLHRIFVIVIAAAAALAIPAAAQDHFGITQKAAVSGTVHAYDGHPVANARVELLSLRDGSSAGYAYTTPSGTFEIDEVADGAYEVVAVLGISETRERLQITAGGAENLSLRLPPTENADASSGGDSVSVAELKVPEKARNALKKAEAALDKRELQKAATYVGEALVAYPKYAAAMALRGILKLDSQQFEPAKQDLESAIQMDPNYAMSYIALGATYNVLTQYEDAIRTLDHGISLSPRSWQGYFEMSKALLGKGDYETALHQLDKTEDLAPKGYAPIHLVRAHALLGLKNYDAAMLELETYLQNAPKGATTEDAQHTLDKVKAFRASNGH
jgi:tetratricopeptide (TPR) repeat protein